jgi:Nucleotidyl transferase AbiEii toxin, Type IV TA system
MLQTRTVEPNTLGLLKRLCAEPLLRHHFLVGGTSLALQLGHRISVDLDLFAHSAIDSQQLIETLKETYQVQPLTVTDAICISVVDGVKVDLVHFKYPFAFPIIETDGVRLADMRDVAPMKLDAVTKIGSKKDFFDMYFLFEIYGLDQILEWYTAMFRHSTSFHVVKSLTYFADAEVTETPIVFDQKITWEKVKKRMNEVVHRY